MSPILELGAHVLDAIPLAIEHSIRLFTDNGIQFRVLPKSADGSAARHITRTFAKRCRENGIEHRCTKVNHPWTSGQVEWMNQTIEQASVQRDHYDDHSPEHRQHNSGP